MKRVAPHLLLATVALLAAGCAVTPLPSAGGRKLRPAPVVPVDFETHLTVSRHCKRLGLTATNLTDGNLILSFVESSSTSTNTVNGVGQTTVSSGFTGFAYRCPKDVLTSLLASEDEPDDDAEPAEQAETGGGGASRREAGDGEADGEADGDATAGRSR